MARTATLRDHHPVHPVTENDQALLAHPLGVRMDIQHACPECPSPLAAGLTIAPSILCRWCSGSGLLTTEQLARWQREQWRQ